MKYLAYSSRPSVSSKAIKAWFGPPAYYARKSRRSAHRRRKDMQIETLATFPEFVNREALKRIDPNLMDFMYQHADGLDDYLKYANEHEPDPRIAIFPPAEKGDFRGVKRWPSEMLMTDLNCEGYRGKDGRVWRDGKWQVG